MSDVMEPRKITRKSKELDSREIPITQRAPIGESLDRSADIVMHEGPMDLSYLDQLAFDEEPVKILIHKSQEGLTANCTDYIGINGVPAEMLFKNGWVPIGYLPRGISFYTKRKYVANLAAAKRDRVTTNVVQRDNEDPENFVERATTQVLSFSMIEDKNPRGADWLERLIRQYS